MPRPNERGIPVYEYWGFIQRFCSDEELVALAKNIVKYSNEDYTINKDNILDFLEPSINRTSIWSGIWITIIQQMGLAYTIPQDNQLHKTMLADYLADGNSVDRFYYYWALRFQFPFAQAKHKSFKKQGIAIQPVISILEHLVLLFNKALYRDENPFEQSYLTYKEIVLVLSKSKSNSIYAVKDNINKILDNRLRSYDYDDLMLVGYETNENNFSGRARLYFERFDLLKFDVDKKRIYVANWNHYYRILVFLAYRKRVHILTTEESTRIEFFEEAFNRLDPNPDHLYDAVRSINLNEGIGVRGGINLRMLESTCQFLSQQGIHFQQELIEAFLLSIKTKPFVILSGISGVGKTLLPRNIMKMIGNNDCYPVAVAPDWTDNSDMLGYFDVNGTFIIGEFTKLVLEANDNLHIPYFIILDEMNLSRVEYYFAQVLSVMESRYFNEDLNRIEYQDYLFNKAMRERLLESATKDLLRQELLIKIANLKLSDNVYIIGTVNIDESTYPFSKKVLDRANVLEINEIDLSAGIIEGEVAEMRIRSPESINNLFVGKITNMMELKKEWKSNKGLDEMLPIQHTLELWIDLLQKFNEILKERRLNFGYRVRDEVCIYLYHAGCQRYEVLRDTNWWYKYFDQQLVQKILTRFGGEQGELEDVIVSLINLCTTKNYLRNEILDTDNGEFISSAKFPKAAIKLKLMLQELETFDRPSTSFWVVQQ